jgi:hypothetical protein
MPEYAADKVEAGTWLPEEALQKSREGSGKLLPLGLASAGQFLSLTTRGRGPSTRRPDSRWSTR